jgi:hypothetical protein
MIHMGGRKQLHKPTNHNFNLNYMPKLHLSAEPEKHLIMPHNCADESYEGKEFSIS